MSRTEVGRFELYSGSALVLACSHALGLVVVVALFVQVLAWR